MVQDFTLLIASTLLLFLPLIFWRFIFVVFFEYHISRLQFLGGICIGGILTVLFRFYEYFGYFLNLEDLFFSLSLASGLFFSWQLFFLSLQFFLFFTLVIFVLSIYFQHDKKQAFLRTISSSLFLIFLIFLLIGGISIIQNLTPYTSSGNSVTFGDLIFLGFGAICSYYILVSLLEEGGKYIIQLGYAGRPETQNFPGFMIVAASIALGFAFFENIFYTFETLRVSGVGSNLSSLIFLRSIFSTTLHIFASLLLALSFWQFFRYLHKRNRISILYKSIIFFLFGIIVHTLFNLSLTYGYMGFLFFLFFAIYIFLSYIIQQQNIIE